MSNFNEKLKLYFKKRSHRLSVSGLSVRGDWYALLVLGAVLSLCGLAYAAYLYQGIVTGSLLEMERVDTQSDAGQKKRDVIRVVEALQDKPF